MLKYENIDIVKFEHLIKDSKFASISNREIRLIYDRTGIDFIQSGWKLKNKRFGITIVKLEDEWWMCGVFKFMNKNGTNRVVHESFRCDQLDGLLDCLKYIKEDIYGGEL